MIHELKTHPAYFEQISSGKKTFELRKNDRDFKTDDILILGEYDPEDSIYTGKRTVKKVTSVLHSHEFPDGIKEGYCIMSVEDYEFVYEDFSSDTESSCSHKWEYQKDNEGHPAGKVCRICGYGV